MLYACQRRGVERFNCEHQPSKKRLCASCHDRGGKIASTCTGSAISTYSKNVHCSGATIYHYDLSGHLIAETNASGQTLVEYIYLGDQPLAQIRPAEQVYYYHTDHLGAPQVMTNSSAVSRIIERRKGES